VRGRDPRREDDGQWRGTRARIVAAALAGGAWLVARNPVARAITRRLLTELRVANDGAPFVGDGPSLATLSPKPGRASARLRFSLGQRASVSLQILETGQGVASEQPSTVAETALGGNTGSFAAGTHELTWSPPATLPPRTYIARISARASGQAAQSMQVVVRVLGVDAAFAQRSAQPGAPVTLVVRTDARTLTVQMLRSGPETDPTYANNEIKGVPVGAPTTVDWTRHANAPAPITLAVDPSWPSGVYAARLDADDGRVGFAPLIVRPAAPRTRVAVVMPTSTWCAYNFYDADGDGWGDTWYARWRTNEVDLTRPHATRGVPYRYRSYDLGFQHWLARTGKDVDHYADEDIEAFASAAALRAAYDLLVFPGHSEYVTSRLYDLVEAFRDLGGNLMLLSANNFFRRIDHTGHKLELIDEWRDLGRPEAGLLGVQYVASDRGRRRAPFTVAGAEIAPWAFEGTGLANGSTFGLYGIEIDARAPTSPAATQVLATIPDLFGPGRSAEMTYYEHSSGAKVFSAGALDFGGQMLLWPQTTQLVENVWQRLG
jgi:N,N-dimethylformamidase